MGVISGTGCPERMEEGGGEAWVWQVATLLQELANAALKRGAFGQENTAVMEEEVEGVGRGLVRKGRGVEE